MLSYGRRPKNLTSLVCKKIWRVSNSFMSNRAALESVLNNKVNDFPQELHLKSLSPL